MMRVWLYLYFFINLTFIITYLLSKWESSMGKHLAQGHDVWTNAAQGLCHDWALNFCHTTTFTVKTFLLFLQVRTGNPQFIEKHNLDSKFCFLKSSSPWLKLTHFCKTSKCSNVFLQQSCAGLMAFTRQVHFNLSSSTDFISAFNTVFYGIASMQCEITSMQLHHFDSE